MEDSQQQKYTVTVVRDAGSRQIFDQSIPRQEEVMVIITTSEEEAYKKSTLKTQIKFLGQVKRVFINGQEYFNHNF